MVVHFKSVIIDVLHVQKWKEPVIIASEGQNFGLIYNSSYSEIFVRPHGSSLWDDPQPKKFEYLIKSRNRHHFFKTSYILRSDESKRILKLLKQLNFDLYSVPFGLREGQDGVSIF